MVDDAQPLIVGPKKLPQLGRGLGEGMREFKDGITSSSKDKDEQISLSQPQGAPTAAAPNERQPQTAAAPGREAGSEPRA